MENVLEEVKSYWQKKVNVSYETGDADADNYMKWISFQPVLRRIYGCSFSPHTTTMEKADGMERSLAGLSCTPDHESGCSASDDCCQLWRCPH